LLDKPLLMNAKLEGMTYKDFEYALGRAGKSLGWPHSMCQSHCLRISGATTGAKSGLPDHELMFAGDWHSGAYKRYVRPTPLERGKILRKLAPKTGLKKRGL
jgi:hypothetical protein